MRRVCWRYAWAAAYSSVALIFAGLLFRSYQEGPLTRNVVLKRVRSTVNPSHARIATTQLAARPSVSPQCQPRQNIFFLKTHKCGSSTIMNIFLRYGFVHDLYFVLPKEKKTNYVGHPDLFNRNMVFDMRRLNITYNIFTHHCRFRKEEIAQVMPRDTVYVTIVRQPEYLFNSLYNYYNLKSYFKVDVHNLLRNRTLLNRFKDRRKRKGIKHGHNQMSFDMGLDVLKNPNATVINNFIRHIEKSFELVMLTERMDESLVLLKHLLCWRTEDVVAFKLNANHRASYKVDLSADDKARLRRLNYIDMKIYNHFFDVFDQKIIDFGVVRMAREVAELQQVREDFLDACKKLREKRDIKNVPKKQRLYLPRRFQDVGMRETCTFLSMPELKFHDLVWREQNQTLQASMRKSRAKGKKRL